MVEKQKKSFSQKNQKQSKIESEIADPVGKGWRPSKDTKKELDSDSRQQSSDSLTDGQKRQTTISTKKADNPAEKPTFFWRKVLIIGVCLFALIIFAKFGVIGIILGALILTIFVINKLRHSKIFGIIVGEARGVKERSEQTSDQKNVIIRTFHIERYNNAGNRSTPVPVEMRGKSHKGLIREGDQIEVRGKWGEGQVIRVSKVYNKTTQSQVKAKKAASSPLHIKIGDFIGWTLWYLIMGVILVGLFFLIKSMLQ